MSIEINDIKEDPFNDEISDISDMVHVLYSLSAEYESVAESMKNDLGIEILTVESLKEQTRSNYKHPAKEMSLDLSNATRAILELNCCPLTRSIYHLNSMIFRTELDELQARTREDPLIEEIPVKSFMILVLNSLPVEYKSLVESMEKNLDIGILTVESPKEQGRSKYMYLVKKMNLKDNKLALETEVDKHKSKYSMNKKQGFKGNCRIH